MTFWDFLLGVIAIAAASNALINFMRHRQNMAKLKAWKLDGTKIAAAAKKHLPIQDGHYVVPEEWKETEKENKFRGWSNSGFPL